MTCSTARWSRFDVAVLKDRAAAQRSTLLEKGWLELPTQSPGQH